MHGRDIPLRPLLAFEVVARHRSFREAARELHLSASAISRQMRQLEEFLGKPLFVRGRLGVELSSFGRSLLPSVRHAVEELAGSAERIRAERAVVRVSLLPVFALQWVAPRLSELRRALKGIELQMRVENSVADLRSGGCDLAIRGLDAGAHSPGLSAQPAATARQLHPARRRRLRASRGGAGPLADHARRRSAALQHPDPRRLVRHTVPGAAKRPAQSVVLRCQHAPKARWKSHARTRCKRMSSSTRDLPGCPARLMKLLVNAAGVTLFVEVSRVVVQREEAAVALVQGYSSPDSVATRRTSLRSACIASASAAGVIDVGRISSCCLTCHVAASVSESNTLCANVGRAYV